MTEPAAKRLKSDYVSVQDLLTVPNESACDKYYKDMQAEGKLHTNVEIRYDAEGKGKGLYCVPTSRGFAAGDVIVHELPLVGLIHTQAKQEVICCSRCFRFLDSVEQQLQHRWHHIPESADKTWPTHLTTLPFSKEFPLPRALPCRGRCGAVYCSKECEEVAWDCSHSLLCTRTSPQNTATAGHATALKAFQEHAASHNDVLLLAAEVIACTLLRAQRFAAGGLAEGEALLRAWQPFHMGCKALWWECATPDAGEPTQEFRDQVRALANESLDLLKVALGNQPRGFQPLLELDVWASILGMFDLNNLSVKVYSPVNLYFEHIAALEEPALSEALEQAAAMLEDSSPHLALTFTCILILCVLEELGDAADGNAHCEGTGFFAAQSCMNHCCTPNAMSMKQEDDRDGHAVIRALRAIKPGEEITISYMDIAELSVQDRRAALMAQYLFHCSCERCQAEEADEVNSVK